MRLFNRLIAIALAALVSAVPLAGAMAGNGLLQVASGGPQPPRSDSSVAGATNQDDDEEPTLDQKFNRRFPQPVEISHLIGLPVLDLNDSTIGYVQSVVRRSDGEIDLIVPYSAWFGWLRTASGKRLVAVPIKSVALLARQINALEFTRDDFADAPDWTPTDGSPIGLHEKTLIALGRR